MDEMSLKRSQEEADKINFLFALLSQFDVEYLKQAYERMEGDYLTYQTIGIVDGLDYFKKVDNMEATLERFEAVINLLNVFNETQKVVNNELY